MNFTSLFRLFKKPPKQKTVVDVDESELKELIKMLSVYRESVDSITVSTREMIMVEIEVRAPNVEVLIVYLLEVTNALDNQRPIHYTPLTQESYHLIDLDSYCLLNNNSLIDPVILIDHILLFLKAYTQAIQNNTYPKSYMRRKLFWIYHDIHTLVHALVALWGKQ